MEYCGIKLSLHDVMQDEVGHAESLMGMEAPGFEAAAFDVLMADASAADTAAEWSCRVPGCLAVCAEASDLANHYSIVHASSLDLTIPPTVIEPTGVQPDSDADSQSSASDGDKGSRLTAELDHPDDGNRWPGISCPFAGCELRTASYPGLVMHHKRVHGVPLPSKQRRAIATVYRARRLDAERMSDMPAAGATSVPHTPSPAVVTDSFVCPFSSCGMSCSSRDDLIAHVHLSHDAADVIQPVCKQETDDSTSA